MNELNSHFKGEITEQQVAIEFLKLGYFLDYEKHDPIGYGSGNFRNGSYSRTITSKFGDLNIVMPRDRKGDFTAHTVTPYQRRNNDLETTIIQLYSKGIITCFFRILPSVTSLRISSPIFIVDKLTIS